VTEEEWLACADDPCRLLYPLRQRANDLKFRLFALAQCHRARDRMPDERSRRAVDVAGRYAEGRATEDELARANEAAWQAYAESRRPHAWAGDRPDLAACASTLDGHLSHEVCGWLPRGDNQEARDATRLVHEVFGNPYRAVAAEPHWLAANGGAVRKLAQGIHEDADFDRMGILADALEDAGCAHEDLLRHCREEPCEHHHHVRGCWAVDLLRGLDGLPAGPLRTEEEWLAPGQNLMRMVSSLGGKVSGRKLRLFAVACCRRIERSIIQGEHVRRAIGVAERYADGHAGDEELRDAARRALTDWSSSDARRMDRAIACAYACVAGDDAVSRSLFVDRPFFPFAPDPGFHCLGAEAASFVLARTASTRSADRPSPRELVLDVFGNPFRPKVWQGSPVRRGVRDLAREIYEERAFDRLPRLADALQAGGCADAELLAHLRGPARGHVRGCWALDLVLGRA
jgi:hypothetical protein